MERRPLRPPNDGRQTPAERWTKTAAEAAAAPPDFAARRDENLRDLLTQHIPQRFRDPLDLRLVLPFHHDPHEILRSRVAHQHASPAAEIGERRRERLLVLRQRL